MSRFSETELVKLLELPPPGLGFYLAYTPDHPGKPSWTRLRRGSLSRRGKRVPSLRGASRGAANCADLRVAGARHAAIPCQRNDAHCRTSLRQLTSTFRSPCLTIACPARLACWHCAIEAFAFGARHGGLRD